MTNSIAWFLLIVGVVFASASSLLLRYGGSGTSFDQGFGVFWQGGKLWLGGMMTGWLGGLAYSVALTRLPITKAAVLYMPLVYILTVLGGVFLLKEDISTVKKIGVCVTTLGLIICCKD